MSREEKKEDNRSLNKKALAYSTGQVADQAAYQSFTILVFTFYFAVIKIDILLITIGFVIWSFWNSFNDPFLGWLSDKTHTKYGRRLPYIMLAIIPLGITLILLFTPPSSIGITDKMVNFAYFMVMIIYKMFTIPNYKS